MQISHGKEERKPKISVYILSPTAKIVNATTKHVPNGYQIDYIPLEVGRHTINIQSNDEHIQDSPFYPEIYDARQVKVGQIGPGIIGKRVVFQVNCQDAGDGTMTVDVRSENKSQAPTEIAEKGDFIYEVIFVPLDNTPHTVKITFNGEDIESSPFICPIDDGSGVRLDWNRVHLVPVSKLVNVDINPSETGPISDIKVKIVDPRGMDSLGKIEKKNDIYLAQFMPTIVGNYTVTAEYSGQIIPGSPFTCSAYDVSKVEIIDIEENGQVGDELSFTIDTSKAGAGDLDVEVNCSGQLIRTVRDKLSNTKHRFRYIVQRATDHEINVLFNLRQVPGTDFFSYFLLFYLFT